MNVNAFVLNTQVVDEDDPDILILNKKAKKFKSIDLYFELGDTSVYVVEDTDINYVTPGLADMLRGEILRQIHDIATKCADDIRVGFAVLDKTLFNSEILLPTYIM